MNVGVFGVQMIGLALLFIYGMPWQGRPPVNLMIGRIGGIVMGVAAFIQLCLTLQPR